MDLLKAISMACALFAACVALAAGEGEKKGGAEAARPEPAQAGDGVREPRDDMRPLRPGVDLAGNWVSRFLMQDENLDKLGIEGDARAKLKSELEAIGEKMKEIQGKIREAGMEQGKLMREAMETPGADMSLVFAKVREIGDMRTEQSILSTKLFVVVRDNLTKEQHAMVRDIVIKEGRQRMEARREFNGNMERRRPQFEGWHRGGHEARGKRGRDGDDKGPGPEAAQQQEKPADKK